MPAHSKAAIEAAYHRSWYPQFGLSLADCIESPDLRASLNGMATAQRRRIARLANANVGTRIEKTA